MKLNVNPYGGFKDHELSMDKQFGSSIDTESKELKQAICQIKDTFQSKMNPEFTGLLDTLVAFISSKQPNSINTARRHPPFSVVKEKIKSVLNMIRPLFFACQNDEILQFIEEEIKRVVFKPWLELAMNHHVARKL
jgi:hypothetical protein